jgi:signal transduction histidine kinase
MTGFAITNTGSGIASYALPHIFDRFYRADSSRTTGEQKSYGLGLSLAKKIVELHGGDLTVSSGINQLTTFRVLLPTYHKNN